VPTFMKVGEPVQKFEWALVAVYVHDSLLVLVDGGSAFLRNVGELLPYYTASYTTR
jgi:phage terminase large subunit-like protein